MIRVKYFNTFNTFMERRKEGREREREGRKEGDYKVERKKKGADDFL